MSFKKEIVIKSNFLLVRAKNIQSIYGVLNKIYLVLALRYLNVVAEFIELLVETMQLLYLL